MKALFTIKNGYKTKKRIKFLNAAFNSVEPNCGLPPKVFCTVLTKQGNGYNDTITYRDFLNQIRMDPLLVAINKSSNNRQLNIFAHDYFGNKWPLEPRLTIDGKPRPIEKTRVYYDEDEDKDNFELDWKYITPWNPKKWNIADTHEKFIMDVKVFINIALEPKQKFEIEFEIFKQKSISEIIHEQ